MSRIVQGLLLAWIAYDLAGTATRWRLVIQALIVAGLVVAVLGLAEAANVTPIVKLLTLFRPDQTHVGDGDAGQFESGICHRGGDGAGNADPADGRLGHVCLTLVASGPVRRLS